MTYGKHAQGKDAAEDQLPSAGDLALEEDGHGDQDDHNVRGDVEGRVGDEVVRRCRTLYWEGQLGEAVGFRGRLGKIGVRLVTVIRRDGPILVEWSTPNG